MNKYISIDNFDNIIFPHIKEYLETELNPNVEVESVTNSVSGTVTTSEGASIDTGVEINYDYTLEIKAKGSINGGTSEGTNISLIAGGIDDTSLSFSERKRFGLIAYNKTDPRLMCWCKGRGSTQVFRTSDFPEIDYSKPFTVKFNKNEITFKQMQDDKPELQIVFEWSDGIPASGAESGYNLFLFRTPCANVPASEGPATIYYAKIYDADGTTLLRHFVPCYNKKYGKYGMLDKVENKFYLPTGNSLLGV